MIRKLTLLVPVLTVAALSGQAFAQNTGDCRNMLTVAVGLSLDSEGYDTDNVCSLSVSELALIKSLVSLALFGLAAYPEGWWWQIIGFITMLLMFRFASIPLMETRSLERRPGYQAVMDTIPMLWPRRPK